MNSIHFDTTSSLTSTIHLIANAALHTYPPQDGLPLLLLRTLQGLPPVLMASMSRMGRSLVEGCWRASCFDATIQ